MANLSLAQLREAQKANPPLVNADGEPFIVPVLYQKSPAEETGCPSPEGSLPLQASPTVQPVSSAGDLHLARSGSSSLPATTAKSDGVKSTPAAPDPFLTGERGVLGPIGPEPDSAAIRGLAGVGYTHIFPPEFPSLLHVPADWKAANWSCNSQWCHVEGAEGSPEFESNLVAVEQSPEVVGATPGC